MTDTATNKDQVLSAEELARMLGGINSGTDYEEGRSLITTLLEDGRMNLARGYESDDEAKSARLGAVAYSKAEGKADRFLVRKPRGTKLVIVTDLEHDECPDEARDNKVSGNERAAKAREAKASETEDDGSVNA